MRRPGPDQATKTERTGPTYRMMGEQEGGFVSSRSASKPGRSPGPFQQPNERSNLAPRLLGRCHRANIDEDARRVEIRWRRRVECGCETCAVVDDVELLLWRGIVGHEVFDEIDRAIIDHLNGEVRNFILILFKILF